MKVMLKNASLKAFSHICFIISFQFCKLNSFCTTQLKIKGWQFGKEMALKRQFETCNLQFQLKLTHNFALKNFKLK
jgi:hypothetical protein